jgi:hypothetical protein
MVNRMIDQFLTGTEWGRLDALVVDLPPGVCVGVVVLVCVMLLCCWVVGVQAVEQSPASWASLVGPSASVPASQ